MTWLLCLCREKKDILDPKAEVYYSEIARKSSFSTNRYESFFFSFFSSLATDYEKTGSLESKENEIASTRIKPDVFQFGYSTNKIKSKYMSLVTSGLSDQARHKPACAATEAS